MKIFIDQPFLSCGFIADIWHSMFILEPQDSDDEGSRKNNKCTLVWEVNAYQIYIM